MPSHTPAAAHFTRAALYEMGPSMFQGFMSAYFRTFAIPQIACELVRSGATLRSPEKRAADTGIAIYEIIVDGHDGPRGRRMTELLRRVHRGVRGTVEDYQYVLASLLVTPARHLRRYGPRELSAEELEGGRSFYTELGNRIGTTGLPATYAEWEQFVVNYEMANARPTKDASDLLAASLPVFRQKLPPAFRFLSRSALSALLADDVVVNALQLPRSSIATRLMIKVASRSSHDDQPLFTPGRAGETVYGDAYDLFDVGPFSERHSPRRDRDAAET